MSNNNLFIESNLPTPLSKAEFYDCLKKYYTGDKEARNKIIKHNIRLVINRVTKRFGNTIYDKNELVSIGIIGLIKSVDTFDISTNYEFTTYAVKCIDNEILMFMRKAKKYMNVDSINQLISEDSNGKYLTLEDILSDDTADFVADYEKKEVFRNIRKTIDTLPYREKEIVLLYFGFKDDHLYSQQQIADKLNISNAHVSRLLTKTVEKLGKELVKKEIIESNDKIKRKKKKSP